MSKQQWYLFLFFLLFSFPFIQAQSISQSVIGNAGEVYSSPGIGDLHFTIGEIAVETYSPGEVLSQGFHQTYFPLLSTAVWEYPELDFQLSVYPNPATHWLTIETDAIEVLEVSMMNVLGQQVLFPTNFQQTTNLDVSKLPSGMYVLNLMQRGRLLKTFKIQKTNF